MRFATSETYEVRTLFSYVLSVNVRNLKIIINLIRHKNALSEQKQKRQCSSAHKKHLREKKSLIRLFAFLCFCLRVLCFLCFFVLLVLFVRAKSFRKKK